VYARAMNRAAWGATLWSITIACFGCGGDPPAGVDAGTADSFVQVLCTSDEQCDDGLFCNGPERCAPGTEGIDAIGCARAVPPCLEGQRCLEAEEECASLCMVSADADRDGADAIACGGTDCDDTDDSRSPDAVEVCDAAGVDEDCDPTTIGDRDADGDGFIDALCCNTDDDTGTTRCGDDCSDSRRDMHPGLAETCDYLDNDCDTVTDETASVPGFLDEDRDLHGDSTMPMTACADTPGFSSVGDDCNDGDPEVHSAQLEICDGKDNNCNGMIDEAPAAVTWYADDDADGFGIDGSRTVISCTPVPEYSLRSSDCNDGDILISPAAAEQCNGIDDNCNGRADFRIRPGDYEDDDGDGHADRTCGGDDCDDASAAVHPGAPELCDGIDNDCDGIADGADAMALWYLDLDADGYGDEGSPPIEDCDPQPARVARGGDCDDSDARYHPGVADLCDGLDLDCDSAVDEDSARFAYYIDADRDNWGDSASPVIFACRDSLGRSTRPDDCVDSNDTVYPGALELCDRIDNDCDDAADEEAPMTYYPDVDRDGHGTSTGALMTCMPPSGYAPLSDDCDDGNPVRFPTNAEVCDLIDNDCDGTADEDGAAACAVMSGVGACIAGSCTVASCTAGHADCDGRFESGCEVETARNPAHCGGCGMPCALGDTCGRVTAGVCDRSPIVRITASESHTFALRSTGGLIGWGENTNGQVGVGSTVNVPAATNVMRDVIDVAAGIDHSCAVTSARRVYCWGINGYGQLGDGTALSRTTPAVVPTLTGAVQVVAGERHSCALLTDGSVWCWGNRAGGQVGDGYIGSTNVSVPTRVIGIDDAVEIVAGFYHTCARRPIGGGGYRVQCWGSNAQGQLGIGTLTPASRATAEDVLGLPTDAVAFSHGAGHHVCVRLSTGRALCWGMNDYGGQANGSTDAGAAVTAPAAMTLMGGAEATGVLEICASQFLGCILRDRGTPGVGEVLCSGADDFGQLGDGSLTELTVGRLQPVVDPAGGTLDDATAIACARNHACAVRADSSVWCWGNDGFEQLGNGLGTTPSDNPTPIRVVGL
jgi:hypothetical protein